MHHAYLNAKSVNNLFLTIYISNNLYKLIIFITFSVLQYMCLYETVL